MQSLRLFPRFLFLILFASTGTPLVVSADSVDEHTSEVVAAEDGAGMQLAARLTSLSGMDKILAQVPTIIERGLQGAARDQSTESADLPLHILLTTLRQSFMPTRLLGELQVSMSEQLSVHDLAATVAFFDSSIGRRIVEVEQSRTLLAMSEPKSSDQAAVTTDNERDATLAALEQAWQMTDTAVDMMITMQVAMTLSIMPALPAEMRMEPEELLAIYESQRSKITAHYKVSTRESMRYIYSPLAQNELEHYLEFVTQPLGARYVHASNVSLKKVMLESSYLWGRALTDALQNEHQDVRL